MRQQVESWMLQDLLERNGLKGGQSVIVFSSDGLLMGRTDSIERDVAETLAASGCGLVSLAQSMDVLVHGQDSTWRLGLVEASAGFLLLAAAGAGAYIGVVTDRSVDLDDAGFRVQQVVQRIGDHLSSPPREDAGRQ